MKSNKEVRANNNGSDETLKKAVKLAPIKKSGKDKHHMYSNLDDEDDEEYMDDYKKKESVLDYYDDGEEDEDYD